MCFTNTDLHLIDATVRFKQQSYIVSENDKEATLTLVLSNPSSFIVTAKVLSTGGPALGK